MNPLTPLPLCLLVPFGPGPRELSRLDDLVEACLTYADLPLHFVVVNDGNDPAALARLAARHGVALTVRTNPRCGAGDGWMGGLAVGSYQAATFHLITHGAFKALLWIARNLPCAAVLKIDTDALVINGFARQIADIFAADATLGMAGNFDTLTGVPVPSGHIITTRLYWRSKRVSHDRELRRITFSLWGWRRRIRLLIQRAVRNGYVLGDWCQGGAYALSPVFLQRLAADPAFARPLDFLHIDFCEDVLMALIVHALGLKIHYTAGPSRLFASKWKGLFAEPAALAEAGHGVVHSVKEHPGLPEDAIREFFRNRRHNHRLSFSHARS